MVGDVDGDGYGDFAFGNYSASDGDGEVLVFYGNPRNHLEERVQRIAGPDGHVFGESLAGGDFSGDGLADLVVDSDSPRVYYYRGSPQGLRFAQRIVATNGRGSAIGAPGDFNGDGLVDLVLAFSGLVYHSQGMMDFAERADNYLLDFMLAPGWYINGLVLASPGDLDSDGDDDLMSSSDSGTPMVHRGVVYLLRGGSIGHVPPANTWLTVGASYIR